MGFAPGKARLQSMLGHGAVIDYGQKALIEIQAKAAKEEVSRARMRRGSQPWRRWSRCCRAIFTWGTPSQSKISASCPRSAYPSSTQRASATPTAR